jgi:4-amino-4-deoxy-L-arabinose transferase-like glycosyltransferase
MKQGTGAGGALGADRRDGWPWAWVICGYFLFQAFYRRLLGGGLALDEAEILLWGQTLALGYGPQPPLYAWLQWAALRLVPDPLLALALLKNALLATTYLAVYAMLRTAHPRNVAGLAALSLLLLPPIAWDSQRDMTHTVLALALAALATLVFWTRALPGRPGGWALFGLLVGLGAIAKANFALVPASLLLAVASIPELRKHLRPEGTLIAVAIVAAIVAAPAWWAYAHSEIAFASVYELKIAEGAPGWRTAAAGLRGVAAAVFSSLALAALVLALLYRFRRRPGPAGAPTTLDRLLLRTTLFGVGLILAGVLATGTTHIRDLWLLPVLYPAAPLAACWLLPRVTQAGARDLRRTILGLAILVTGALAVHIRYGDPGHPSIRRAPIAGIAADLEARFPEAGGFVAYPEWLAGNLVYRRPDLPVVSALHPPPAPPLGPLALVWWDDDAGIGERLARRLSERWDTSIVAGAPVRFAAPYPPQPEETFRVDAAPLRPVHSER